MVRIIYYRNKCIGCGACVEASPQRWHMSKKDGKSTLLHGKPKKDTFQVVIDDDDLEKNKTAAANCPVSIIKVNSV